MDPKEDPDLAVGGAIEAVIGAIVLGVGIVTFIIQRSWFYTIVAVFASAGYLFLLELLLFPRIAWKRTGMTVRSVRSAVWVPFILDAVYVLVVWTGWWHPSPLAKYGTVGLLIPLNVLSIIRFGRN